MMLRRLILAGLLATAAVPASAQIAYIAPTAPASDSSDRIANTAWVNGFLATLPLASGKIWIGSAGNIAVPQTPSGDCTISIPGVITCTQAAGNFNVIGNLTVGGTLIDINGQMLTNIAAPATPAAGTTRVYTDSTTKILSAKNDAGTVSNTVVPSTCSASQWVNTISTTGALGCTQPARTDISGFGTNVATALGVNVGTAGAFVVNGGVLGTPSSGVATNLTGTAAGLTAGTVTTNANLTGDVTSVGNATTLTNAPVIAKVLTGYTSGAGTISAADSILTAIQKLNGNDGLRAIISGTPSAGQAAVWTSSNTIKGVSQPTVSTALNTGTATGTGGFVSGTYTTPAGATWLEVVRAVGGGGGSAGSGTTGATNGTAGGQTCLSTAAACTGTVLINAGGGGAPGGVGLSTGGAGGSASVGGIAVGVDVVAGGGGVGGLLNPNGASSYPSTGAGGSSCLGGGGQGGGANSSGGPGAANTGGGGGGPGANAVAGTMSGAAGGAGGCVTAIIVSPAASYFYSIGAAGAAGGAGTSGNAGSAGGTGAMKIIEHYN